MGSSNFRAQLRQRGKIVPGSLREGHNVFTDLGRTWLTHLIPWLEIADGTEGAPTSDAAEHQLRIRWIQLGEGCQLEAPSAQCLKAPLVVSTPIENIYLKEVLVSFPFVFGARYNAVYLEEEILPSESIIQEAGLCVGSYGLHLEGSFRQHLVSGPCGPPMGVGASIDWESNYTRVTGLAGMAPWMEGMFLTLRNSDHNTVSGYSGYYGTSYFPLSLEIKKVYSDTVVDLAARASTGADSHNPDVQWCLGGDEGAALSVVAYKSFAPLVKTRDFQLEVQWDLRF